MRRRLLGLGALAGAALAGAGVWLGLTTTRLSGGTILGCLLIVAGGVVAVWSVDHLVYSDDGPPCDCPECTGGAL